MVDRMYIGHIPNVGASALTGVGVTMPVIMAISAFAALVSMGGAPRSSIMMGKNDKEHAEQILGNCTILLFALALILTIVFMLYGKSILMLFGASDTTIGFAWDYLHIGYFICTDFFGLKRVYHFTGLCENKYDDSIDRCLLQHYFRPDFHLCF